MKPTPNRPVVIAAALCALVLAALQTHVIFSQGWSFTGIPHGYVSSALQVYYDRDVAIGSDDDPVLATEMDNRTYSPLYRISTLLGWIGEPTPPWFRMTGVVLLLFIFVAAWYASGPERDPIDRLLTAVVVSTTPAVLHVTRRLEDHGLYVLALVAAVAIARHAMARPRRPAWDAALYALPGLVFFFGLMYTYQTIVCVNLACILAYYGAWRIARRGRRELWQELARWLFAGAMVVLAIAIRSEPEHLRGLLNYYMQESGSDVIATAWDHAIAYPQLLFYGMAGPLLCALAALNVSRRLREPHAGLLLAWAVVPIALLSLAAKKELMYGIYAAPAIALLACSPLFRLPAWAKGAAIAGLLAAAVGLGANPFPLAGRIDSLALYNGSIQLPEEELRADKEPLLADAQAILDTAAECGPLNDQAILVLARGWPNRWLTPLNFAMLSLDRRPRYLLPILLEDRPYDRATIVDCDPGRLPNETESAWLFNAPEVYSLIRPDGRPYVPWHRCRIYCPVEKRTGPRFDDAPVPR